MRNSGTDCSSCSLSSKWDWCKRLSFGVEASVADWDSGNAFPDNIRLGIPSLSKMTAQASLIGCGRDSEICEIVLSTGQLPVFQLLLQIAVGDKE